MAHSLSGVQADVSVDDSNFLYQICETGIGADLIEEWVKSQPEQILGSVLVGFSVQSKFSRLH